MHYKSLLTAAFAGLALAQRPSDTSICDYYTKALLGDNTPENQLTVLTLVVNTVVAGNYTKPKIPGVTFPDVAVPGILAKGTVNGETVNLLPYFDGTLASTNRGGMRGVSVNFLDGGGATPLLQNKAASDTKSNQYFLLTHLYQFFGTLLGCSEQGMGAFPSYEGQPNMYSVHKFMVLDEAQFTYFVMQVGLAASSFGVADSDVKMVGESLNKLFGYRCAAPIKLTPDSDAVTESICQASDCPKGDGSCPAVYPKPMPAGMSPNATMTKPPGSTPTGGSSTSTPTAGAASVVASFGLLGLGLLSSFFL